MVDVTADVLALIAKAARIEHSNVKLTDKLMDMGIESVDVIELTIALEEKFDISVPYNEDSPWRQSQFETVGDVVRAISELVSNKA